MTFDNELAHPYALARVLRTAALAATPGGRVRIARSRQNAMAREWRVSPKVHVYIRYLQLLNDVLGVVDRGVVDRRALEKKILGGAL